jgi:hypothetical protein
MAEYCFYPNLAECLDKVRKDNIAAVDIAVAYIKNLWIIDWRKHSFNIVHKQYY